MKLRYLFYTLLYIVLLFLLYVPSFEHISFIQEEGFIELYFCDEINCSYFLTSFLNTSTNGFCALYDLDEPSLIQSLHATNTSVKLFEENYESWMPETIQPVGSKGLMHHKFCVVEDYVLTGSWNPTERGTYKNDNYIVFLKSPSLATNYELAFDSLDYEQQAQALHINLSGVMIENYFCPKHSCEEEIIEELQQAQNTISVLAFSFTSKPIAEELISKYGEGVDVQVLFEKTRIASYSQYKYLNESGVTVYKDTNPYTMHEKAFIIDKETVIIGSYNPTRAANTKNDENILIIHDNKIARVLTEEFTSLI